MPLTPFITSTYGPSTKTNEYGYEVTVANGRLLVNKREILKLGKTNTYCLVMANLEVLYVN